MSWFRPKPPAPEIPAYKPPIEREHAPKEEGITVDEVDTRDMSATGIFKAWKRMTGQGKGG